MDGGGWRVPLMRLMAASHSYFAATTTTGASFTTLRPRPHRERSGVPAMENESINRREFLGGLVAAGMSESLPAQTKAPAEQATSPTSSLSAFIVNTRYDTIPSENSRLLI